MSPGPHRGVHWSMAGDNAGNAGVIKPGASQTTEDIPASDRRVSFKGRETCRGGQRQPAEFTRLCSYKPWVPQKQSAFGQFQKVQADLRANLFIIPNPWAVHWGEAAPPCYVQNETKRNIQAAKETWSLWRTEEVTVY